MNRFVINVYGQIFVTYISVLSLKIPVKDYSDVLFLAKDYNDIQIQLKPLSKKQLAFLPIDKSFANGNKMSITGHQKLQTLFCNPSMNNYFAVVIISENVHSGIELSKSFLNCSYLWTPTIFILPKEIFYENEEEIATAIDVILKNMSISVFDLNSDVFLMFPMPNKSSGRSSNSYSIWELYEIGTSKIFQRIENATGIFEILPKSTRRQDFRSSEIKVVALEDLDYKLQIEMEIDENGNVVFTNGLCLNVLKAFQAALNFTYKAIKGEGWVEELPNGTWIGMAKQIINDEADISITMSSMVDYRLKKLTFLTPFLLTKIYAYFRQPQLSSIRDILIGAFSPWMWFSLISIWFLISIIIKLFHWIKEEMDCVVKGDEEIIQDLSVYSVSVLAQQGWYQTPQSISTRIVFISGTVLSLVSYVALSATLVSSLSTKVVPIKSYDDLARSHLNVLGDKWAPYSHHFVRDVYTLRRMPLLASEKNFIDIDTGVHAIIDSQSAFLTFFDAFMTVFRRFNYSDRFFCDTVNRVIVTNTLMPSGIFVKKGSPLKEIFNHKIALMYERGIAHKLNKDFIWEASASCPEKASHFHTTLGINDVFTAYIILLSGFVGSNVFLIVEIVVFSYQKHVKVA